MAAEYAYNIHQTAVPVSFPAPQRQPAPAPRPTVVPKPKRTPLPAETRSRLERRSNVMAAKLFVVMALAIALLGIFCNSFAVRQNSRRQLENATNTLNEQTDAHIVLEHKLSKLVSADNIDRIATKKLGLVKIGNGSETYLELNEGDKVIFSLSKN